MNSTRSQTSHRLHHVTSERLQVSEAGVYKSKKMHRDPDPTDLTGTLTKQYTWSYIKILLYVLTITHKSLVNWQAWLELNSYVKALIMQYGIKLVSQQKIFG